jgi:hypothetical protein
MTVDTYMELTVHRCVDFHVLRHYPDINNAMAVEIVTESGGVKSGIRIMMFGQPEQVTKKLMTLRDSETTVQHNSPLRETNVAA